MGSPIERRDRLFPWAVLVLLAAIVAAIYGQTARFEYVFDDELFILGSAEFSEGLSARTVRWAFTSQDFSNWLPLTRLSLLADTELFGRGPGPSHVVNALLHLAGAWCLYLVLAAASGAHRASAALAALWAAHPLQVESVAWVTERSMLLATLFLWVTIGAYLGYVRRPGAGRYLLVILGAVLSFLAKPIAVTVPALLLLLDWWPLGRMRPVAGAPGLRLLAAEKLPLALLGLAFGFQAVIAQQSTGSMASLDSLPLLDRAGVAARAAAWHVQKAAWPSGLCVYYPLTGAPTAWWRTAGACALLAAISVGAARTWRARPQLAAGWLWFAVALLPVSGLLQAGTQATADRFAYIPLIGLLVMAAGVAEGRTAVPARGLAAAAVAVVAFTAVSIAQTGYWRNELTLFGRALSVEGGGSWIARFHLGEASEKAGDLDAAIRHHQLSLVHKPRMALTQKFLGVLWARKGDLAAAERHLHEALLLEPEYAEAQVLLDDVRRCAEQPAAAACFEEARRARAAQPARRR